MFFERTGYQTPALSAGAVTTKTQYRHLGSNGGGFARKYQQPAERQISTAIAAQAENTQGHCAAFSRILSDAFVLCYSQPGELVGDPFVGSGTVAISCNRHGRRFVGGDLGHREKDGRRWADIVGERVAQRGLFEGAI